MSPIDAVLRLRPANVVQRLEAGSRVCVLNPRDVQRAVAGSGGVVVVCEIAVAGPVAGGILRAAKQRDAVVGFSTQAHPMGEGPRPLQFFKAVAGAAVDADHELPIFLRAGPIVLRDARPATIAEARECVFQHVDAGFTEVCVDASALEATRAASAVAEVTASARERELSIEVVAPAATRDSLHSLGAALEAEGLAADVVSLRPGPPGDEDLARLIKAAQPATLAVVEHPGSGAAGAKRVIAGRRFERAVESALPKELAGRMKDWMASTGRGTGPAFGFFHRELSQMEPGALLKLEAFAYHEALELLASAGARGTARAAVVFLAEKSGY